SGLLSGWARPAPAQPPRQGCRRSPTRRRAHRRASVPPLRPSAFVALDTRRCALAKEVSAESGIAPPGLFARPLKVVSRRRKQQRASRETGGDLLEVLAAL